MAVAVAVAAARKKRRCARCWRTPTTYPHSPPGQMRRPAAAGAQPGQGPPLLPLPLPLPLPLRLPLRLWPLAP